MRACSRLASDQAGHQRVMGPGRTPLYPGSSAQFSGSQPRETLLPGGRLVTPKEILVVTIRGFYWHLVGRYY